jgi:hypothetical protein
MITRQGISANDMSKAGQQGRPARSSPVQAALANWQFLAPVPDRARALLVLAEDVDRQSPLVTGFDAIDELDLSSGFRSFDAAGGDLAGLACVAVPSAHVFLRPGTIEQFGAWLRGVREALARSGGVYVGGEALGPPDRPRRRVAPDHVLERRHLRLLRLAGFRDVRPYYVSPSLDRPYDLVPALSQATAAWQYGMTRGSWACAARAAISRVGLHAALFSSRLVIACP